MQKIPSAVWLMLVSIAGIAVVVLLAVSANKKVIDNVSLPLDITEYFDYQCTHCMDFSVVVEEIQTEFGDKIKMDYKHFPFLSDASYTYAYAAEAAREQGKFAEFHSLMFKNLIGYRDGLITDTAKIDPVTVATEIGLDIEKFNVDRADIIIQARVADMKKEAARIGIASTPTVYVEGQKFEFSTYEEFKEELRELVKKAEAKSNGN